MWSKYKNHYLEYCGHRICYHFMDCFGKTIDGKYYEFWFYWCRRKIVAIRWFINGLEQFDFTRRSFK